ncbi:MAG TPA: NDP-sugar synthase [candidate division Zixibacteria bacterium]|nr:NDP-sugar synthase [candidate division Zixibacteria bacterium]
MVADAIILCAGYGTRLAPLTHFIPKPLFPVVCKPALGIVMERLAVAGIKNFFCNAHHLWRQIVEAVPEVAPAGVEAKVFVEKDEILGTAGGIGHIFAQIGSPQRTFLVHNGDVLENFDLEAAYRFHIAGGFAATLILVDFPRINTVIVQGDRVAGFSESVPGEGLTYSGVGFFGPEILETFPHDRPGKFAEYLLPFVRAEKVGAWRERSFWHDFGTLPGYLELHRRILIEGEFDIPGAGEGVFFAKGTPPDGVDFYGFCAVCEDVSIPPGTQIANSVVWRGSKVSPGHYINSIITPFGVVEV